MKRYPATPIPQATEDDIRALVRSNAPRQDVIHRMRAAGLHISDCIKLTARLYDIGLTDAKKIVHSSDAWASMRETYEEFHEVVIQAAKEAGFEEVEENAKLQVVF